jgi:diguanylate cyclase (GGDEF)-like protein
MSSLRETDIVTGLYTPGFLVAFGARELAFARDEGYPLSLITLNLDKAGGLGSLFEPGEFPDEIRRLGDSIKKEAGEGSLVARTGESEVSVLLPGIGSDKASMIARRIKKVLSRHSGQERPSGKAFISIGIASASDDISEFNDLIRASRSAAHKGSLVPVGEEA